MWPSATCRQEAGVGARCATRRGRRSVFAPRDAARYSLCCAPRGFSARRACCAARACSSGKTLSTETLSCPDLSHPKISSERRSSSARSTAAIHGRWLLGHCRVRKAMWLGHCRVQKVVCRAMARAREVMPTDGSTTQVGRTGVVEQLADELDHGEGTTYLLLTDH